MTRRFGGRTAVSALDLRVQEGDVYGFLGPNGAGKTTAIRCMLGLIGRDAGEVEIFGEKDPVRQRAHVGAMVETPAFHKWLSARDNLRRATAFAGQGTAADIELALERVGLQGRADEKVQGYSLGMKQRLGIARALVGKPRLLILDEPTNGLDPRGMREIRDLLLELARRDRLTIFVSSHLLGEVEQLCSRVGILERGRMVAEGTVEELLRRSGAAVTEVDLECADAVALGRALEGIAGVSVVGDGEGDRLRVRLDGLSPAELNQRLVQAGVAVSALVPVVKSLEDLFLTLTSQELT
ncbi:ABC transporter ATP-binding protein [Myxococcota bacterium]|nr:ABC transporter ATP-binding protein [Myxococcota bacterium]